MESKATVITKELPPLRSRLDSDPPEPGGNFSDLLISLGHRAHRYRDLFGHSKEGRELSVFLTDLEKLCAWANYHGFDNYTGKLVDMGRL